MTRLFFDSGLLIIVCGLFFAVACAGNQDPDDVNSNDIIDDLYLPDSADMILLDLPDTAADESQNDVSADGGNEGVSDVDSDVAFDDMTDDSDLADVTPDPWIDVAESISTMPECVAENCVILSNELYQSGDVRVSTQAAFEMELDGDVYYFRPWVRFRAPHPGTVSRVWVYSQGQGALDVHLTAGVPGGSMPCLDESSGKDLYPAGSTYRMPVSSEPGWRVFDLSAENVPVDGFDQFFVLFDQFDDARVGLAAADPAGPGDYTEWSGIVADVPADGMKCFPTISKFGDELSGDLNFVVRVEFLTSERLESHRFVLLESGPAIGGHASLGDYDNDGDDDILANGRLYRNNGDLDFVDVTADAGLGSLGGETLWGDFDNDGFRDIVGVGSAIMLYKNMGDLTFDDVTESSGLASTANNQGAAWVDVNGDGYLDLVVASYGVVDNTETAARDYLFVNQGDGTFLDMTESMGMTADSVFHGRGVCTADYDGDGDQDVYVGNYRLDPNFLWQNKGGDAGFVDVAYQSGTQGLNENFSFAYGHTIGPSFGDLDNDGLFDLVVPNLAHPRFLSFSDPTTVYMNQGDGTFDGRRTEQAGISYDETHSDSTLADFDGDGDLDLFLTSVYVGRHAFMYENDGTGFFKDVTYQSGIVSLNGWGAAASDLDGDGDLDLLSRGVWVNQSQPQSVLLIRLEGGAIPGDAAGWSNRDAIGAVVTVTYEEKTITRQVEGGKGVGCQNSTTLHFGLGSDESPVDIHVIWPSGRTTDLTSVSPGATTVIHERP